MLEYGKVKTDRYNFRGKVKMADKGYYYLKLKENFFDGDEMKILESMENGYLYSNILLKLYLKAIKNEGKLVFNEYIPYDVKMLATIVGHNVDVVEKAIKIFQTMHLIEILDNGTIYMMNMQQMIGSISSEGVRKAEYRERIRLEKQGTNLGQCPNIISISNSVSQSNSIKEEGVGEEKNKKEEKESKTLTIIKQYFTDEEVILSIGKWLKHKQEKGQTYKATGFTSLLAKLKKEMENKDKQFVIDEIEWSISNNYSGIYPPKEQKSKPEKVAHSQYTEADLQRYRREE